MKILIQGATPDEIDIFLDYYKPKTKQVIETYEFYTTTHGEHEIIISETQKGIINATTATTIALLIFKPDILINQGCAGAHVHHLKVGDIVIGEKANYINDFKTPPKPAGAGSSSLEWTPHKSRSYSTQSTPELVEKAKQVKFDAKIVVGALGSADTFSREIDRINFLHQKFGHLCEDMESAATMRVCDVFNTKHIAFRVISNNELTLLPFDELTRKPMQQFVIEFVNSL